MIYMYISNTGVVPPEKRSNDPVTTEGALKLLDIDTLKLEWPLNELVGEIRTRLDKLDNVLGLPWYIGPPIGQEDESTHERDNVIISISDIRFRVIASVHYPKGSVYLALQLSQYAGGRLRLIGYLSSYGSQNEGAPRKDDVVRYLNNILKLDMELVRMADELLACNRLINKSAWELVDEMIIN